MDPIKTFENERAIRIAEYKNNKALMEAARGLMQESIIPKYSYNFTWLGRPVIQYPQDIVAMQELIWSVKPDLIIETGIAHGGSLILYASLLELIGGDGAIIGIDIDIREFNRIEIEKNKMAHRIKMIEGSSVDQTVVASVNRIAHEKERIMVVPRISA